MFTNKTGDGKNNLCGEQIASLRKKMHISQRELADRLQLVGLDVDKNAVQRMECGKRFITDIELLALAQVLDCPLSALYPIQFEKFFSFSGRYPASVLL